MPPTVAASNAWPRTCQPAPAIQCRRSAVSTTTRPLTATSRDALPRLLAALMPYDYHGSEMGFLSRGPAGQEHIAGEVFRLPGGGHFELGLFALFQLFDELIVPLRFGPARALLLEQTLLFPKLLHQALLGH